MSSASSTSSGYVPPFSPSSSFMKKTNAMDGRTKRVDDVMVNMEDHIALLHAEIMQIRDDLRLHRMMAKKYGEEGFGEGEQRLLQLKQMKKEALNRVKGQMGKLDRTIKAGKRINKEFNAVAALEERLKEAKEKQRKRRKDRKMSEETRRIEKGENVDLGIYSEGDSGSGSSSNDTDASFYKDEEKKQKVVFKQNYTGDLMESHVDSNPTTSLIGSFRGPRSKILLNKEAPKFKGYFNLAHLDDDDHPHSSMVLI
ncbi:predicted protein [Naegleria gruberi]|uniref:Predicted protein n=1 Tax=Naegleria gruberi TaxID=5762 RepID=D2VEE2_NAEGR|nr:uncharacterized protein NAEGRDRAFT_67247 [Naegleria gruberi]EFC44862.1 predicted protein [Naegleria gruberi]|eukprot:XP_002677606.1 predicted protein [Naegleria gruberi strain NEG-M]